MSRLTDALDAIENLSTPPKPQKLRVWHIPQIPGKPFYVEVASVAESVKMMDVLAAYDAFQFDQRIKGNYANTNGLEMWEEDCDGDGNPGWSAWYLEAENDFFDNPREYLKSKEPA